MFPYAVSSWCYLGGNQQKAAVPSMTTWGCFQKLISPTDCHAKMPNFIHAIMFTVWYSSGLYIHSLIIIISNN